MATDLENIREHLPNIMQSKFGCFSTCLQDIEAFSVPFSHLVLRASISNSFAEMMLSCHGSHLTKHSLELCHDQHLRMLWIYAA